MNARRMVAAIGLLVSTHCGSSESLLGLHEAWPGSQAVGSLMVGDNKFCSATLVAPDVVVTSARCARAALSGESSFRWQRGTLQFDTAVRAGYVLGDDNELTQPTARWRPAVASAEQRAVVRSVQRRCRVDDMFALSQSATARSCLDGLKPSLLKAAGALGLANWRDVGWLGLEDAVPTDPAPMAMQDASHVLQEDANLRRIGVRPAKGMRASPLQRYEHPYRLYEIDATELHAGPHRSRTHDDVGSGLWMETFAAGARAWQLVGVGSRPYVAHSDASAGVVFSRLDLHAAATAAAIARLRQTSPR